MTLTTSKPLNRTWDWNETFAHFGFDLSIKPSLSQQLQNVAFTWEYKGFAWDTLTLWLNFTHPALVSTAGGFDFLEVKTNSTVLNTLFVDKKAGSAFDDDQLLMHYIPP